MTTAIAPSPTLELRPYQEECLTAIGESAVEGINRQLVALPTGTGKTVIFSYLMARSQGRSLLLGHRDELLRQSIDKLRMVSPDLDIGVVKASENEVDARVVVASVQTLSRPNRLEQLHGDIQTVVVDEAHHANADSYLAVLKHLGCFDQGGPLTCGWTATPERGDGAGLGGVWQEIVYQKSLLEMMLEGFLCDLRAVRVGLKLDLDSVHTRLGDFVDRELELALEKANAPAHVVTAYLEHAPDRKALVFTPTVKLAHAMASAFLRAGIATEALDANTPYDQRRAILARLHAGETKVVANCAVLTEGFDSPTIDCIIIARPTKSKTLYLQMIGRGTRPYPGKPDCLILDVVGASARHNVMAADTLFDLDLSKSSVREAAEQKERQDSLQSFGVMYERGELVSSTVNLFQNRSLNWQRTNQGAWVLSLHKGFLRLAPGEAGDWSVHHVDDGQHDVLWSGPRLDYAMGVAEDHARKQGSLVLIDPNARWRGDPASEPQLNALRKWKFMVRPGMTKGEANNLLSSVIGDR